MKFVFDWIYLNIPEVNTLSGLIFYTLMIILMRTIFLNLLKLIFKKFYADEEEEEIGKFVPKEISQRILDARKVKAKEAIEYLKRFN